MSKELVIGSRGSQLALWQANYIAGELRREGVATRIQMIKTTGDHLQTASLVQAGGKGLFTKEIEDALLAGHIDLAVHSLKDLPTESPAGLTVAAIPRRESPFDALAGTSLAQLKTGATVGTSSPRRAAQLRRLRPDLRTEPIRGNVDTRLKKMHDGHFSAILLAAAGLRRLGLEHEMTEVLTAEQMCPAPGQGALGVQTRSDDEARQICARLNHSDSSMAVNAERAALAGLGGGCQLPVGAYAAVERGVLKLRAVVVAPDASAFLYAETQGAAKDAHELGEQAAAELLRQGAGKILWDR